MVPCYYASIFKNDKTPTYAVATSYVMFFFSGKNLDIQAMTMWLQQFNHVIYYKWILGDTATLDYCISINNLSMSKDIKINLLQSKIEKDEDIRTGQYMEPDN